LDSNSYEFELFNLKNVQILREAKLHMKKILLLVFLSLSLQAQYSVKMAESFMKWHPKAIQISETKPARWDYEQGLVLKAIEKMWVHTGDARYFQYLKNDMD